MKWTKSPPELVARFEAATPDDPRLLRRPMFGYPALFLNGNMVAGTFRDQVMVRLPNADRQAALAEGALPFEPMPGRPMKEYVSVPSGALADEAELATWLQRALEYVATLPPKPGKR